MGYQRERIRTWRYSDILAIGFIAALYMMIGIRTLPYYSLTWDEGLGNLFFGQRYFYYFLTHQEKYLDFKTELRIEKENPLINLYNSPFRGSPHEFPPLADTLSAASMVLLGFKMHWLDPIDAFHLPKVVLASLFLFILYFGVKPYIGRWAAFMAVIFLGLFPRYWADMHFNPKDIPLLVLFGLTILAFIRWYDRSGFAPRWAALAGAVGIGGLWGCSLATKANAIFIPLILGVGILPWSLRRQAWVEFGAKIKTAWGYLLLIGITGIGVYILLWPYLYSNPIRGLKSYWLDFILTQGGRSGTGYWNPEPLFQVIATMPEVMLVSLSVGLGLLIHRVVRDDNPFWRILLVWMVFPILRISMPAAVNFDGIRHFMEYVPAAAIIAGLGADGLVSWIKKRYSNLPPTVFQALLLVLLLVNTLDAYRIYFPYLHIYYNRAAGGLQGVRLSRFGADATDYWAVSYREGLRWINTNAEPNAVLVVPIAGWIVDLTREIWLRPDLRLIQNTDLEDLRTIPGIKYVMFIHRESFYNDLTRYCLDHLAPAYVIRVDNVPIVYVFRLEGEG